MTDSQSLPSSSRWQMDGYCPSVLLAHSLAFLMFSKAHGIFLEMKVSSIFISDLATIPSCSNLERRNCSTSNVAIRSRRQSLPFVPRDRMPFSSRKLHRTFTLSFNISPSSGVSFQKPSSVCRAKSEAHGAGQLPSPTTHSSSSSGEASPVTEDSSILSEIFRWHGLYPLALPISALKELPQGEASKSSSRMPSSKAALISSADR